MTLGKVFGAKSHGDFLLCKRSASAFLAAMLGASCAGASDMPHACSVEIDASVSGLVAAVAADLERPVRPGGVDGRPFWNVNGRGMRYIYPPAFDFAAVPGAAKYRFTVIDDVLNEHVFESGHPFADLSPVWKDVPVGYVRVQVDALSGDGSVMGTSGVRRFWRAAPYEPGAYAGRPWSYSECVRRYYPALFNHGNSQHFLKHGTPDGVTDLFNIYPSKMNSALVRGMVRYSRMGGEHSADALRIAKAAADFMISISQPASAPLAHFPPTYRAMEGQKTNFASRWFMGQNMLVYPAVMGMAYLDLYAACHDAKYLDAAVGIAETYERLQLPEGTWYVKMHERDGRPVVTESDKRPILLIPTQVCVFMGRLATVTGDPRWREVEDRAFAYIEKGSLTTWDWSAQFEDTPPSEGYRNPASSDAISVARYMLRRFPHDAARRRQARELMRWVEDQFVFWRKPCRADGRSVLNGPERGFRPWERSDDPAGRPLSEWIDVPGVAEKYTWMVVEDALTAGMMCLYLDFYRLEKDELCLAKAKTLGDAIVRVQEMGGDGEIASEWFASYAVGSRCPHIWLNCSVITAICMEEAAEILERGEARDALLETTCIQAEIDRAFRKGGGRVSISAGDHLIGSLVLRSGVELHLEKGARLVGSRNPDDYQIDLENTWLTGKATNRWSNAMIRIFNASNVAVTGEPGSEICGRNCFDASGEEGFRGPHAITAFGVTNIVLRGYTVRDAGNYGFYASGCANVTACDIEVHGGHDGFDFFNSSDILVENCRIFSGDDCVAGHGNRSLTVRGCTLNSSCSYFRLGGNGILIENCRGTAPSENPHRWTLTAEEKKQEITPSGAGRHTTLSIFTFFTSKSARRASDGIVFRNCRFSGVERLLHYNLSGNERWQEGKGLAAVTFEDVVAEGLAMPLVAYGSDELPLRLAMKACRISFRSPMRELIRGAYIDELDFSDVTVEGAEVPALLNWKGDPPKIRMKDTKGVHPDVCPATEPFTCRPI